MRHKASSKSSRYVSQKKSSSHRAKKGSKPGNVSNYFHDSFLSIWRQYVRTAITFVIHNWGYILFSLFIVAYISTFWDVAASRSKPQPQEKVIETMRMAIPTNPHLPNQENVTVQIQLPGAISSEGKKFENLEGGVEEKRSSNLLPGAIGLTGSFDEHGDNHEGDNNNGATESAKTAEQAGKNGTDSSSKTGQADSPPPDSSVQDTSSKKKGKSGSKRGTKKGKKKGKKKKGKKKKKKNISGGSSGTTESGASTAATAGASGGNGKETDPSKSEKASEGSESSGSSPDNDSKNKISENKSNSESASYDGKQPQKSNDAASQNEKEPGTSSKEGKEQSSSDSEGHKKITKGKKKKKRGKKGKKKKPDAAQEPFTVNSTFTGPHPMNRNMEELQVPGDIGILDDSKVRSYYEKLVKAYLAPFGDGIDRRSFFEILRRKTYSLSPPGSNKGIQTILFQLIEKKLYLMDPYEMTKNSKPFYKTRIQELVGLLSDIAKGGNVPDTEFVVAIHDCVQTVNAEHTYRGSVYQESSPTFTIVSCNFSDNIPFPMWEGDPVRGGLKSWDAKMEKYKSSDTTPWAEKQSKAVFRGGNRPSMFYKTKEEANEHSQDSGRSRLHFLSNQNPDLFDVGVSGRWAGEMHQMKILSEADHHRFKYILYAEGNCFWADRLNKQIFGPSAIIKQETPCGQFWEPLLKPFTHYIPTDFFFQDTTEKIKWAQEHDSNAQVIVKNSNDFAANFLTEKAIKMYVEVLLIEYSKLLNTKKITQEQGSQDVTAR